MASINFKYGDKTFHGFDLSEQDAIEILEMQLGKEITNEIITNIDKYLIKPETLSNKELTHVASENTLDIEILSMGLIEADNKASAAQEDAVALFDGVIEADNKATSAQADTVALFDGLVDVDTRLSLMETSTSDKQDVEQLRLSVNDLTIKVNKILEHLKLTI